MEEWEKIIARMASFVHQSNFRPHHMFNNNVFVKILRRKYPFIFSNINPFRYEQALKNNIKKASAKFWKDLLYFQHFMQIFVFAQCQWLSLS